MKQLVLSCVLVLFSVPTNALECTAADQESNLACYQESIRVFLRSWVRAWSSGDSEAYFRHYLGSVSPVADLSRAEWEADRRRRIEGRSDIRIRLDLESMMVHADGLTEVQFIQSYSRPGYADRVRKQLMLTREVGRLLIVSERTIETFRIN